MKVSDLLKTKEGQKIITITPGESVFNAMKNLLEYHIGALVVCDTQQKIVGILSERDIMKSASQDYDSLKTKKVSDLMSKNLIVAIPEDDLDYVMGIMTQNRIRHIPIVTKEGLMGLISIGDIIKFQLRETQVKNRYLEEYMYGQQY